MKLTQEMIGRIQALNLDEDARQDLYEAILRYEGEEVENINAWIMGVYNNIINNTRRQEAMRKELEATAVETLEGLVGDDDNRDPLEYMEAEVLIDKLINKLSPLLSRTLEKYLEGMTPEQIAKEEKVNPNTIYQRMWQIRKEVEEVRYGR